MLYRIVNASGILEEGKIRNILYSIIAIASLAILPQTANAQLPSLLGKVQVGNSVVPLGTGNEVQVNVLTPEHTNTESLGVHLLGEDHLLAAQSPVIMGLDGKRLDVRLSTSLDSTILGALSK